jgi:hypothetical protein
MAQPSYLTDLRSQHSPVGECREMFPEPVRAPKCRYVLLNVCSDG